MTIVTVELHPVDVGDLAPLSALIVQLYNIEVPGVLGPEPDKPARLFQHILNYELENSGQGRYIATTESGEIVGSVGLRLAGEPIAGVVPPGIVSIALKTVGMFGTLRIFGNMLRTALLPETLLRPGDAFIYSVVVDESWRSRGIGQAMMERIEQIAFEHGARATLLRVLSNNTPARRLYERLGYRVIGSTPRLIGWLSYSTDLMRKELHLD
jgi:ribosomal protein S18 acetylase RimI-like enzyme